MHVLSVSSLKGGVGKTTVALGLASAALNKWIKQVAGSGNVIHGFRHSFRDRLRAVSAPRDMID